MNIKALPDLPPGIGPLNDVHEQDLDLNEPFVDLCARFAPMPGTVALLSGGDLDCARYHLLGIRPWLELSGRRGQVRLRVDRHAQWIDAAPLDVLAEILTIARLPQGRSWPAPLAAGLMGYLAYDLKDDLERLSLTSVDDLHLPHMLFYAPSLLVVHDKRSGRTRLLSPLRLQAPEDNDQLIRWFHDTLAAPAPAGTGFRLPGSRARRQFHPTGLPGRRRSRDRLHPRRRRLPGQSFAAVSICL
jgi:para-aminobenzoate synthetase component I